MTVARASRLFGTFPARPRIAARATQHAWACAPRSDSLMPAQMRATIVSSDVKLSHRRDQVELFGPEQVPVAHVGELHRDAELPSLAATGSTDRVVAAVHLIATRSRADRSASA